MTKRDAVLVHIQTEVANEGKITQHAIRLYVEARVSRKAFGEAVNRGMAQFSSKHD